MQKSDQSYLLAFSRYLYFSEITIEENMNFSRKVGGNSDQIFALLQ